MATDTFTLSPIELACGVTMADVQVTRTRGYVFDDGQAFAAGSGMSPACAGAAARYALGGPVEFSHLSSGMPVYRLARA